MADRKVVFVAFAIEDVRCRDYLKGQSLNTRSPFEYIDMSVKEAYDEEWKARVRTRIKRSDGVLVLVSENSLKSSGQKWEIKCAREEGKAVRGMWCYKDDRTKIEGLNTMVWTWNNIADWIDGDVAPKFYPVLSSFPAVALPCWAGEAAGACAEPLA